MTMNSCQVVVVGAGTRVTRDVLPALSAAGFNYGAISIVRVRNVPISGYKIFDNLDKLPSSVINSNTIFIVCVPPNFTKEVIEKIFKECTPLMILIDTPIANYNLYKQLCSYEKSNKTRIGVLEDVSTIPFFFDATRQQIQKQNKFFRVLYLNNFLFSYHQVAFVKKLDLGCLFLAFKISKWNLAVCGSKKFGISFFLSVFRNDQLGQNLISVFPKFDFIPNIEPNLVGGGLTF